MLVLVGDHLACPEISIPTRNCEEQRYRRDRGFTHREIYLCEDLHFSRAVNDRGFFDLRRNSLKSVSKQDDVHGRHTHGDNYEPLIIHDSHGIEYVLGCQVVQVLRYDTCGEPHGENQEEVKSLSEQQSLF